LTEDGRGFLDERIGDGSALCDDHDDAGVDR